MNKKKENISVSCYISEEDRQTSNFINLKAFLLSNGVFLHTSSDIIREDYIPCRTALIAYSSDSEVEIENHDEAMEVLSKLEGKPPRRVIIIKGKNNISSSTFFTDGAVLLIKLDERAKHLHTDQPHTFYDLDQNSTIYYEAILNQIRNSGLRNLVKKVIPTNNELEERFKNARLENTEFPRLGNGQLLLPGSEIVGSRGFFYDADGVILGLSRVGNSGNLLTDWAVHCGFFTNEYDGWVEQTGLLEWVDIVKLATSLIADLLPSKPLLIASTPLLKSVNKEVMEYIARHPAAIENLTPEAFEDLMCGIYSNNGFSVTKIGNWNQGDGGIDILAVRKDIEMGTVKIAIQCKHSKNTIRPCVIRELNGVIDRYQANVGVVATTSSFSNNTFDEVDNYFWRIKLEDRNKIISKLQTIFS